MPRQARLDAPGTLKHFTFPYFLPTPDLPPLSGGRKTLSPTPYIGYNPHYPLPSDSVQLALPGGPVPAVAGLFCVGPAG